MLVHCLLRWVCTAVLAFGWHLGCSDSAGVHSTTTSSAPTHNANTPTGANPNDANSVATSPNTTTTSDPNHPQSGPLIRYLGRFDQSDANQILFAWPASSIFTRVLGTGLTAELTDTTQYTYQGATTHNFYDVFVDGVLNNTFAVTPNATTYIVAQNLAYGDHIIRLSKRTEPQMNIAAFSGFAALSGGNLLPAPQAQPRLIEFIGDSITAGYGADGNVASANGNSPQGCPFSANTENADETFASMTAANLGAEFVAVAFSGKGIVQNDDCYGDPVNTLPVLYNDTVPLSPYSTYDFSAYTPGIVVINLGTNDYNEDNGCSTPASSTFVQGWVNFVRSVRSRYPDATIFCTVGPELAPPNLTTAQTNIQSAVSQLNSAGDANVLYVELAQDTGANGYGCAGHPNKATHAIMADAVTSAIQTRMGW